MTLAKRGFNRDWLTDSRVVLYHHEGGHSSSETDNVRERAQSFNI